jgi:ribosomal protein S18 acetylase RimI-like enzyme
MTMFRHAESEAELITCHPLMRELRPHLDSAQAFVRRARLQQAQGWRLLALWNSDSPIALAGYRWMDNLVHGRFLYVDDLVTAEAARSQQLGGALLAELERMAVTDGAKKLVLDTAMANARAQRFYFRCGLLATALHFTKVLA